MIFGNKNIFAIEVDNLCETYTYVFLHIQNQIIGKTNEIQYLSGFSRAIEDMYYADELPEFMLTLSDSEKIDAALGRNKALSDEQYDIAFRLMYQPFGDTFDNFIFLRYRENNQVIFLWRKWENIVKGEYNNKLFKASIELNLIQTTIINFKIAFFKNYYNKAYKPPEF